MQSIGLWLQVVLYMAAGVNHFIHPGFYTRIMPPYLPDPNILNLLSGLAEIVLGLLLIFPITRTFAAIGIMAMLIAFIPAHVYMIQVSKSPLALWLAWLRLVPGQPLLIYWAYSIIR